jgi:hypothetical protein
MGDSCKAWIQEGGATAYPDFHPIPGDSVPR